MRALASVCAAALFALVAVAFGGQEPPRGSALAPGRSALLNEVVVPGPELEVAPANTTPPLVLRMLAVRRHGDAFRYDFEYWGRAPGRYDLLDYVRRVDGSPVRGPGVPELIVEVHSVLPAGQILPNAPAAGSAPRLGGYRVLLAVVGVLWFIGLVALVRANWRRRGPRATRASEPQTLADVLRPLVARARTGELSREDRARLELALVALWQRRLGLEDERPERTLALLRAHPEASPLLTALESWLHRPPGSTSVDVESLLAPYAALPADAFEVRAQHGAVTKGVAAGSAR